MASSQTLLRVGALGAARITPKALIAPLIDPSGPAAGIKVVAVAARDHDRAIEFANKHGIAKALRTYQDVITDPEVDAVYNALPASHHLEWTVRALEAGKHVLCEKPFALNADQAKQMATVAEDRGLICMEAFHNYYHPLAARIREVVLSGELGTLRRASGRFVVGIPERPDQIRYRYETGGGATMDLGCYPLHLLRHTLGEVEVLSAQAGTATDPKVDLWLGTQLRVGGVATEVFSSMEQGQEYEADLQIEGDLGSLKANNPVVCHRGHSLDLEVRGNHVTEEFGLRLTYSYMLDAFRDAITLGTKLPTDARDGVKSMEVIDAVYNAAGLPKRGESRSS